MYEKIFFANKEGIWVLNFVKFYFLKLMQLNHYTQKECLKGLYHILTQLD